MSKSFNILPTHDYIPTYKEVIEKTSFMLNGFLKSQGILKSPKISIQEFTIPANKLSKISNERINTSEETGTSFIFNSQDWCNLYYYKINELDKEVWDLECKTNMQAAQLKHEINKVMRIQYSWQIVRTAGHGPLINLAYGYIAIAIGKLTNGIIYSDDGAWQHSCFPIGANDFEKIYLNLNELSDKKLKHEVQELLESLI